MNTQVFSRPVTVAALLAGAIPLAVFYLAQPEPVVFQKSLSLTGLILATLSLAFPLIRSSWWRVGGLGVLGGSVGVSIVYIFVVGPGNLWPLAISLTTLAVAIPIAVGTGAGWLLGSMVRRLRRQT